MNDYEEENRNRIRKFIFRMIGVGLIFICILCFIIPSHALPLEDIIKTDECCMGEDVDYYSTIYYPYNVSDSSLAGYKVIDKNIPYSIEGVSSTVLEVQNTEYLIQSFITPVNDPYLTSMASGTRAIIAGMINAIKEQQTIIENQEKRIADLEKRFNKIEGVKDV